MVTIKIDKKSGKPLYMQIRDRIQQAIHNSELSPGDKLPTVTAFAKQVGVTQATIRRAFEDLGQQGLTQSHVGRGTFVADPGCQCNSGNSGNGPQALSQGQTGRPGRFLGKQAGPALAARKLRKGVSKGLCDLMAIAGQPDITGFAKGIPDPKLMDSGLFEEMVALALKQDTSCSMAYGDCQGILELRETIAARYGEKGVNISPDQILITNGAQQGASIAALDAAEKNRHVIFETPGFQGIVETFVSHGNWVDTVMANNGSDLASQLELYSHDGSKLFYFCPDFHNPTGMDTVAGERKKLASWARQNKGILLCDEIFQDLRLEGDPAASMIGLLGDDQVIVISSLSKALMSGLRVGWMISSPRRIAEFTRIKRLMDQACPPLMQGIALQFFKSKAYDAHLQKIQKIYTERRDIMLACLAEMMPKGVEWTRPKGGFALWVTLPRGYSSVALLLSVLDKGINFLPGPIFDIDQRFVNCFRLSWAWSSPEQIAEGMEILADGVKELLRRCPGDSGLSGLGHFQ